MILKICSLVFSFSCFSQFPLNSAGTEQLYILLRYNFNLADVNNGTHFIKSPKPIKRNAIIMKISV